MILNGSELSALLSPSKLLQGITVWNTSLLGFSLQTKELLKLNQDSRRGTSPKHLRGCTENIWNSHCVGVHVSWQLIFCVERCITLANSARVVSGGYQGIRRCQYPSASKSRLKSWCNHDRKEVTNHFKSSFSSLFSSDKRCSASGCVNRRRFSSFRLSPSSFSSILLLTIHFLFGRELLHQDSFLANNI